MRVTYWGHSCFSVEVNGKNLLFDPFITGNPLAKSVTMKSIHADYILVSHGHGNHIRDLIEIAKQTGAQVITNYEIGVWLGKQGVDNVHSMNIGGHWIFDFGKVKCVNAVHSSSLPDGTYGGNPMGFLIEGEKNFYYAGDTALHYDMKLIGDFKKMAFSFLPIGNNYTMGIDNAVIASEFIKCEKIIGMHFDSSEQIAIDHKEAKHKFDIAGRELILMKIGEVRDL